MAEHQTQMYFAENFAATRSSYSLTMTFTPPLYQGPPPVAVVLPLVVAKQLCMVLRKQILSYEDQMGAIPIPGESFKAMGVSPDDWENWLRDGPDKPKNREK